jgi:hypothetical protein
MAPLPRRSRPSREPQQGRPEPVCRPGRYTTGPRGQRVTAGWPGSGLFWTEKLKPAAGVASQGRPTWVVLLVLAALIVVAVMMMR